MPIPITPSPDIERRRIIGELARTRRAAWSGGLAAPLRPELERELLSHQAGQQALLLDRPGCEGAIGLIERLDDPLAARGKRGHRLGGSVPSASRMSEPPSERRSAFDRRRSNWSDATAQMLPTA